MKLAQEVPPMQGNTHQVPSGSSPQRMLPRLAAVRRALRTQPVSNQVPARISEILHYLMRVHDSGLSCLSSWAIATRDRIGIGTCCFGSLDLICACCCQHSFTLRSLKVLNPTSTCRSQTKGGGGPPKERPPQAQTPMSSDPVCSLENPA